MTSLERDRGRPTQVDSQVDPRPIAARVSQAHSFVDRLDNCWQGCRPEVIHALQHVG
jgi:hypothetical protein